MPFDAEVHIDRREVVGKGTFRFDSTRQTAAVTISTVIGSNVGIIREGLYMRHGVGLIEIDSNLRSFWAGSSM